MGARLRARGQPEAKPTGEKPTGGGARALVFGVRVGRMRPGRGSGGRGGAAPDPGRGRAAAARPRLALGQRPNNFPAPLQTFPSAGEAPPPPSQDRRPGRASPGEPEQSRSSQGGAGPPLMGYPIPCRAPSRRLKAPAAPGASSSAFRGGGRDRCRSSGEPAHGGTRCPAAPLPAGPLRKGVFCAEWCPVPTSRPW